MYIDRVRTEVQFICGAHFGIVNVNDDADDTVRYERQVSLIRIALCPVCELRIANMARGNGQYVV